MHHLAVILTDAERRIMWVNKDFESITGYGLPEVVGLSPGKILQGPKTEREAIKRIQRGLAAGVAFKETLTNYRKNGEPYLCKLVIRPLFNSQQRLTNYLAFEVDGNEVKNENSIPAFNLNERYRGSSLSGLDEMELFARIGFAVEKEQLYLDPNLTLRKLADHLGTNTKYLSQVVNNQVGSNFLTYLNGFRVRAVCERLDAGDSRNQTFFGIARHCGFKNKSTFYRVFKEVTGGTPGDYSCRSPLT